MTRLHTLHAETGAREHHAETILSVDGTDIRILEQATHRADGTLRKQPRLYNPADPVGLLPPDSRVLLPTTLPVPAMIGICSCGEPGCDSLWMQVRRDRDLVVWEPTTDTPRASIRHTYRFALLPYLDALDDACTRAVEERPQVLARELRASRDSLFGAPVRGQVLDVRAWPGTGWISVGIVAPSAVRQLRIVAGPHDSLDDVLDRIRSQVSADNG